MGLKTKNDLTKTVTEADLMTMEGRAKDFTKLAIETIPSLSPKELAVLDKEVTASGENIAAFLKTMEQKTGVKI